MRNHRGLFTVVMAVVVLQCQWANAQDDEDDRGDRDDRDNARNSDCTSNLGGGELRGTLNVAARCQLTGADIRGDVIIFAGGSLVAHDTRIRGSLQASRADFVELDGVRVDRNVSLQELVGDSSRIESSDLRGSVVLTSNRSRFEIVDNRLRNDLGAFGNTGGLQIAANDIGGNLTCTGNAPAPTVLGNRIEGDAQGQCAPARPQPTENPPPPQPTPTPMPTSPPRPSPPTTSPPTTSPPPSGASPSPSTPTMPAASPPATPEAAAPPATAAPPPAPATPATPGAATPPAAEPVLDDGGAGAIGWPLTALLLPLVAWRRLKRAREVRDRRTA
ncbi:MAG TPA: GlyGly-CTERM sorting domain-containing protein [Gammaproteobacteria bacterium]